MTALPIPISIARLVPVYDEVEIRAYNPTIKLNCRVKLVYNNGKKRTINLPYDLDVGDYITQGLSVLIGAGAQPICTVQRDGYAVAILPQTTRTVLHTLFSK
jgi:hypothetical protein